MANSNDVRSMYYRYFVYSEQEATLFNKAHPTGELGTVVVNGVAKKYTSIVLDTNNLKSDATVVTKGDIRKIKYINHKKK